MQQYSSHHDEKAYFLHYDQGTTVRNRQLRLIRLNKGNKYNYVPDSTGKHLHIIKTAHLL